MVRASPVVQMIKNPPAMPKTWVRSLVWEDPLEEGMATHSSILAWKIPMDRGAWRATVQGVAELDMTERLSTAQHMEFKAESSTWVLNFSSIAQNVTSKERPSLTTPHKVDPLHSLFYPLICSFFSCPYIPLHCSSLVFFCLSPPLKCKSLLDNDFSVFPTQSPCQELCLYNIVDI